MITQGNISSNGIGNEIVPDDKLLEEHNNASAEGLSQYLTFIMAGEEYGVDILCVQEIRGWEGATPIPNAESNMRGVINLRGTIVPIIDLRQAFGLQVIEYTDLTVVIVLKVHDGNRDRVVGIVVDEVSEVYSLDDKSLKHSPEMGEIAHKGYVKGLTTINDRMVILLQIDKLLSFEMH